MILVARDDGQLDLRLADVHGHAFAVVLDRDDVAAFGRDELEQLDERAGAVGDARAHDEVTPGERQPVAHDRDQERRVDVPARKQRAHLAVAARLAREQRGDRRGAGALDNELRAFEQQVIASADLFVLDVHEVVEQVVEDRHRQLARVLDGDAVGDRAAPGLPGLHPDDAARRAAARAARSRSRRRARRRRSAAGTSRRRAARRRARDRSSPARRSPSRPRTRARTSRLSPRRARALRPAPRRNPRRRAPSSRRSCASRRPWPSARPAA